MPGRIADEQPGSRSASVDTAGASSDASEHRQDRPDVADAVVQDADRHGAFLAASSASSWANVG